MDRRDEHSGRMGEIYEHLSSAYSQSSLMPDASNLPKCFSHHEDKRSDQSSEEDMEKGKEIIQKDDRPCYVNRTLSSKAVLGAK